MQRNYPDRNGLTLLTKNKSGINKSGKKKSEDPQTYS